MSKIPVHTCFRIVHIKPKWAGKGLAVHKPLRFLEHDEVGFCSYPGIWVITHIHTGYSAGKFHGNLKAAIAFARQWDDQFAQVKSTKLPNKLRRKYIEALAMACKGPSKADIIEMGV